MRPTNAELFAQRQRSRHDRAAWVRPSTAIVVIALIRLGQYSVGERCLDGSAENLRGNYCCDLLTTISTSELDRPSSRGKLGSRNHSCHGIEDVVCCLPYHALWQRSIAGFAHICAEADHDWADFFCGDRHRAWKGPSGDEAACSLQ